MEIEGERRNFMISKLFRAIKNPKLFVFKAASLGWFNWMDDATYLKMRYRLEMGRSLDLDNPKTFNEKLQWLKIHDRKPEYTTMVDKYAVKKYVADIIGEEYIISTLGKWDRFDNIDFDALPNQFVLKCNHDSGSIVIVRDKSKLDKVAAKKKIERGLKRNGFWYAREWPYKDVKPCIIAEKYMEDSTVTEQGKPFNDLRDYKFFCFDGKVECFKIDFDRFINHRANYFDKNGRLLPFGEVVCPPDFDKELHIPEQLTEMVNLAEKLSAGKSFVRVDFYCSKNKVFFGELTFYPAGGMGKFVPDEWDEKLGKLITIPDKNGGGVCGNL